MNPIRTPRIATWLLNHFGCSPRNDELLGDLIERYRSGRSRTWYWKQVLLAVLSGFASEIGTHKSRVLAALTAGWAFLFLYEAIFVNFFESLNPNSVWVHYIFTRLLPDGWRAECGWAYRHSYDYVLLAIECAVGIVAGFVALEIPRLTTHSATSA